MMMTTATNAHQPSTLLFEHRTLWSTTADTQDSERYTIHYGTQAKYNQWQGLARANKLPNTTALKLLKSAHRPSPRKHSPDGATGADIR